MFHILCGTCPKCGKWVTWVSCEPKDCKYCSYIEPETEPEGEEEVYWKTVEKELVVPREQGT